jgi:3'(2'), 5'-bisphosphate nucleotidase
MLTNIINIVKTSNQIALEIYNNNSYWINTKDDNTPLTKADIEVNTYICNELKRLYPDIPIISEESKQLEYNIRKTYTKFFLVDPIDGTKEFIKRTGDFTINIAYCENNYPIFGVVGVPVKDIIYFNTLNRCAYKLFNASQEEKYKINFDENVPVSSNMNILPIFTNKSSKKIVATTSHYNEDTRIFLEKYKDYEIVNFGSSLKIMAVAEGEAYMYPRLSLTSEWDIAASLPILESAGGKMLCYGNNNKMEFNKENILNPYFICYS